MSKAINITGQRFGNLVAIKPTKLRLHSSVVWDFRCDCGNLIKISYHYIIKGYTKSCGCKRTRATDLTGQKFGRWLVLSRNGYKQALAAWLCRCDCGNTSTVESVSLTHGRSKSCGCLNDEKRRQCTVNIKGQRYGRLVVVKCVGVKGRSSLWLCKCDCGNTVELTANNLRWSNTKSCGCLTYANCLTRHTPLESGDVPMNLLKLYMLTLKIKKRIVEIKKLM
jgi:hypothetical protein